MAAEWRLTQEVDEDISAAYGWYESQRLGLGEEFLSRVDACIQQIVRNPEAYPFVFSNYRRAMVRQFPYTLFFEATVELVTIYSVFHTSRDPRKWRERLP